MTNYIKMAIFIFAIIPFSIIYFLTLFGLQDIRNEFILKLLEFVAVLGVVCLAAIIILFAIFKIGTLLIDKLSSRSYEINSPTTQAESQNIEPRGATVQESSDKLSGSRAENKSFDFGKYKPGSNEAANAYKQSSEHRNTVEGIRQIDEILKAARKELSV